MRADAVGDVFDQRRAEIASAPARPPIGDGVDGEVVVAVDPQRGDAEAEAARGEGAGAAAGDALEGRDRPLVVDDVEDHRRVVGRGEDQRGVEVRLSAVEPSPIHPAAILVSFLIAEAIAQPTAWMNCVARLPEIEKKPWSRDEYITGSCRPFSGSRSLEKIWLIMSTSG